MDKKAILVFGAGVLQRSIIERAKLMGLYVVGIDSDENAVCKAIVDAFEVIGGQDYEGTLKVAQNYKVSGIVTAATDKPLVMMARIAEELKLPFYSVDTAVWSTDKLLMKQRFQEYGIPCAKGFLLDSIDDLSNHSFDYPVIVKPRDNSGSRGVIYCKNREDVIIAWNEAISYTKKNNLLIEEFIEGKEYSIESLHYDGKSHVVQFTEKITTDFPYNVELGHIQPADLSEEIKEQIKAIINQIAIALHFENCASHTELKIGSKGITIIETSPRLGGDYITSHLVPLSTGINIEDLLLEISLNKSINIAANTNYASAVCFFDFPLGKIDSMDGQISNISQWDNMIDFHMELKEGDTVNQITSSLNRYGYFMVKANSRKEITQTINDCKNKINEFVHINRIV